MNRFLFKFSLFFSLFFSFCCQTFAAEVLQVSSSSVLLIGDNNRTYTVKIACADISSDSEEKSLGWLRKQLPRHTKVNLKPKGSVDGVLVARVIPFKNNVDITEEYIRMGLAKDNC